MNDTAIALLGLLLGVSTVILVQLALLFREVRGIRALLESRRDD